MLHWVMTFQFNSLLGVLLYWLPLSICVYGYTARTWLNYRKDVAQRSASELADDEPKAPGWSSTFVSYRPTDTIGTLIGRAVVTVLPIGNLWAASFDVAPEVFRRLFDWFGRVFDIPLVPKRR